MNYGIVISNHTFDTLYVLVVGRAEDGPKKTPVYALTHGSRVSIPKTLIDFDDNIFLLGVMKKANVNRAP